MVDIWFANLMVPCDLAPPDCSDRKLFSLHVMNTFSGKEGYFYHFSSCLYQFVVYENTEESGLHYLFI